MTLVQAVQSCFSKYGTFDGRATRSEFWWFYLANILIGWIAYFIFAVAGNAVGGPIYALVQSNIIQIVINIVFFIPFLAVSSRRLHDTNRSAWWILLGFTIVGLIPLIMWWAQQGAPEANQYGPPVDTPEPGASGQEQGVPSAPAAATASAKPVSKPDRAVASKAADVPAKASNVNGDGAEFVAPPSHADRMPAEAYQPARSSGGSNTAVVVALIVLLAAAVALAFYLKPWTANPANATADYAAEGDNAGSDAEEASEEPTQSPKANGAKAAPRRAHAEPRMQSESVGAGDVSIEESADGGVRIRAGDIQIEDE